MANDPLNDVRSVRRAIAQECGGDPEQVLEYYRKHQEAMKQSTRFRSRTAAPNTRAATDQTDARERD